MLSTKLCGPILPVGSPQDGIISKIKKLVPDPISGGFLKPSASSTNHGNINNPINWFDFWQSRDIAGSYYSLEFLTGYIKPTHYTLKGFFKNARYSFATSWTVLGIDGEGVETVLGENTSFEHNFCEPKYDGGYCGNDGAVIYSLKPTKKSFKSLKWVIKQCSTPGDYYLLIGGIEIFGSYSIFSNSVCPTFLKQRSCNNLSIRTLILFAINRETNYLY